MMWFDYIKEIASIDAIVTDYGFATYKVFQDELFVEDLYIKPEYRKGLNGKKLFALIMEKASERGCKVITGQVKIDTNAPESAVMNNLRFGFKILGTDKNIIYFKKEVQNG